MEGGQKYLCRPYGAKTIGVSLYPPLTQWATVVTPRWGVFVLPHKQYSESMAIVPACYNKLPCFKIYEQRLPTACTVGYDCVAPIGALCVALSPPRRGVTTVAHCASGGTMRNIPI